MPRASTSAARCGHHRRVGRCAGARDEQRAHALGVAHREVQRDHAAERAAGDVEGAVVGRRDLVGEARHRRRARRPRAAAEAREDVPDGVSPAGSVDLLPAAGVEADRRQQHERHAAEVLRSAGRPATEPSARMPDDPAGRSGGLVSVAQHEDVNPPVPPPRVRDHRPASAVEAPDRGAARLLPPRARAGLGPRAGPPRRQRPDQAARRDGRSGRRSR